MDIAMMKDQPQTAAGGSPNLTCPPEYRLSPRQMKMVVGRVDDRALTGTRFKPDCAPSEEPWPMTKVKRLKKAGDTVGRRRIVVVTPTEALTL